MSIHSPTRRGPEYMSSFSTEQLSSIIAELAPSPEEIVSCENKLQQALDAIDACKALLVKHQSQDCRKGNEAPLWPQGHSAWRGWETQSEATKPPSKVNAATAWRSQKELDDAGSSVEALANISVEKAAAGDALAACKATLAAAVASGEPDTLVAALHTELDAAVATVKATALKFAAAEKTVAEDAVDACRDALAVAVASGDEAAVAGLQKQLDAKVAEDAVAACREALAVAVASGDEAAKAAAKDALAVCKATLAAASATGDTVVAALHKDSTPTLVSTRSSSQIVMARTVSELSRDQMEVHLS